MGRETPPTAPSVYTLALTQIVACEVLQRQLTYTYIFKFMGDFKTPNFLKNIFPLAFQLELIIAECAKIKNAEQTVAQVKICG